MKTPTDRMSRGIFAVLIANISKETQVAWRDTPGTQERHGMVMLVKSPTGHENLSARRPFESAYPQSHPCLGTVEYSQQPYNSCAKLSKERVAVKRKVPESLI